MRRRDVIKKLYTAPFAAIATYFSGNKSLAGFSCDVSPMPPGGLLSLEEPSAAFPDGMGKEYRYLLMRIARVLRGEKFSDGTPPEETWVDISERNLPVIDILRHHFRGVLLFDVARDDDDPTAIGVSISRTDSQHRRLEENSRRMDLVREPDAQAAFEMMLDSVKMYCDQHSGREPKKIHLTRAMENLIDCRWRNNIKQHKPIRETGAFMGIEFVFDASMFRLE